MVLPNFCCIKNTKLSLLSLFSLLCLKKTKSSLFSVFSVSVQAICTVLGRLVKDNDISEEVRLFLVFICDLTQHHMTGICCFFGLY